MVDSYFTFLSVKFRFKFDHQEHFLNESKNHPSPKIWFEYEFNFIIRHWIRIPPVFRTQRFSTCLLIYDYQKKKKSLI